MSLNLKQGNKWVIEGLCKDANGVTITNLTTATAVLFQLKEHRSDVAPLIEETLSGGGIQVDTPSQGYITITVLPAKTVLASGKYLIAVEIRWASNNDQEAYLEDEGGNAFDSLFIAEQIIIKS